MSNFTVTVRDLKEGGFKFGLDKYPIFDESYRARLNDKIINHFWFREIGQETPEMFKFMLNREMNEIMPYYNQMYLSAKLAISPLLSESKTETSTRRNTGTNTLGHNTTVSNSGSSEKTTTRDLLSDTNSKVIDQETPQGEFLSTDIDDQTYASKAGLSHSIATDSGTVGDVSSGNSEQSTTGEDTNSIDMTDNFTKTLEGFTGSQSKLLMEYRQTFLNIDMDVINKLEKLFMLIWE